MLGDKDVRLVQRESGGQVEDLIKAVSQDSPKAFDAAVLKALELNE
jgi:hypothetical protein